MIFGVNDPVVCVAIAVLTIVFVISFGLLIFLLRLKYKAKQLASDEKPILKYSSKDEMEPICEVSAANSDDGYAEQNGDNCLIDIFKQNDGLEKLLTSGQNQSMTETRRLINICLKLLATSRQIQKYIADEIVGNSEAAAHLSQESSVEVRDCCKCVEATFIDLVNTIKLCATSKNSSPANLLEAKSSVLCWSVTNLVTTCRLLFPKLMDESCGSTKILGVEQENDELFDVQQNDELLDKNLENHVTILKEKVKTLFEGMKPLKDAARNEDILEDENVRIVHIIVKKPKPNKQSEIIN